MNHARRLVLVGGGHAHVEVLRRFGLAPEPGVEIVLVSPAQATPYSGMLPGLVAGHYRHADCHIDLPALCRFAGARFVQDAVTGLPNACRSVLLQTGGSLEADLISLDVGSTPPRGRIAGADRVGTGVKPVDTHKEVTHTKESHTQRSHTHPPTGGPGPGAGRGGRCRWGGDRAGAAAPPWGG